MGKKNSIISKSHLIAWIMLLVAIGFLCYAFQHPEGGWPWSNTVSYTLYIIYLLLMLFFFIAPFPADFSFSWKHFFRHQLPKLLLIAFTVVIFAVLTAMTSTFLLFALLLLQFPKSLVYYAALLPPLFFLTAIANYIIVHSKYSAPWLRLRSYASKLFLPFTLIFLMMAFSMEAYQEQITVPASTMIQLERYYPFQPASDLARLDHPASLQLTSDYPVVDGATALVPVYAAFVNAVYQQEEATIYNFYYDPLRYFNTVGGYMALAEGRTDILFAAYPSQEQLDYAQRCHNQLSFTPIGREGFVFFVNASNPVSNLTSQQLRAIYSGEITNWQQVGGPNRKIEAFQRNAGSGSQSALLRFMGDVPLMTPPQEEVYDLMSGIIYETADYKNHSNAIGFSFRYYAQDMIADKGIQLLSVDGVAPTVENIRSGAYPLTSDFYAVTSQQSNANSQVLIDWILSPEGQQLIEATGYAGIEQ